MVAFELCPGNAEKTLEKKSKQPFLGSKFPNISHCKLIGLDFQKKNLVPFFAQYESIFAVEMHRGLEKAKRDQMGSKIRQYVLSYSENFSV